MSEKLVEARNDKKVTESMTEETNSIFVIGEIVEDLQFGHEVWGEKFYNTTLRVIRTSGQEDVLPLQISERLIPMWNKDNLKGKRVRIDGQIRSYSKKGADGEYHLNLVIFAKSFELLSEEEANWVQDDNIVYLEGYICKPTVYRVTPFGRQICDLFLGVNRQYNKSDYIPCIAWGRNAVYADTFEIGDKVRIQGRFQSRGYVKGLSDGTKEFKVTYELSAQLIVKL